MSVKCHHRECSNISPTVLDVFVWRRWTYRHMQMKILHSVHHLTVYGIFVFISPTLAVSPRALVPVRLKSKMSKHPRAQRLPLAFLALCAIVFVPSDCNRLLLVDLGSNGDGDVIMPQLQEMPKRRTKQGDWTTHLPLDNLRIGPWIWDELL